MTLGDRRMNVGGGRTGGRGRRNGDRRAEASSSPADTDDEERVLNDSRPVGAGRVKGEGREIGGVGRWERLLGTDLEHSR